MIFGLFRGNAAPTVPQQIYGAVMAQARQPSFFRSMGVPDTVIGRLDVLVLHLVILAHRLTNEPDPMAGQLSQEVFDAFTMDLDRTLREMGIGDTSVPKRKKRLVHSYFGQLDAVGPALDTDDMTALEAAISERFFNGVPSENANRLAKYALAAKEALAAQSFQAISTGELAWPEPGLEQKEAVND